MDKATCGELSVMSRVKYHSHMDDSNTLEFVDTFVLLLNVVDLLDPRTSALHRPHTARSECPATQPNPSIAIACVRGGRDGPPGA